MTPFTDTIVPGEKRVLTFDFSSDLAVAETLSGTPTITVSCILGSDTNPSALLNGSSSLDITNKLVLVPVQPSVVDCDYTIKVVITTSDALKVLALIGVLKIRN
jgi:hypothetical protein